MTEIPLREDVVPGPGPVVHPENAGFWDSLNEGTLRLQRCSACQVVRFPVAPCCWHCLSIDYEWVEVEASGTVAASTNVMRATGNPVWQEAVPFLSGLVDTAAGVRLPGRILCRCGRAAAHGTPVRVVRIPTRTDQVVYAFEHDCERSEP